MLAKESTSVKDDDMTVLDDLLSLVSRSVLPEQNLSFDQPLQADLITDHVKNCEDNFKDIISLMDNLSGSTKMSKKVVLKAVLLCGEHSKSELWSSPQTLKYSKQLLNIIMLRFNCPTVASLLLLFKIDNFLIELRPKLLQNSWKNNPAAIECFIWILLHIKCPDLGDVFNSVLPTCLLLIDDHVYSNKIKGLQCLQHVANNVSRAELNQFGRGSLIYNALEHMIYLREPEIIPPLASCLAELLGKTEQKSTTDTIEWTHFDDVLNIWLPSMEMEQKLLLREAYINSLADLLQSMGLASVRWSKKLLSIFSEYCEQDYTRDKALWTLLTFIRSSWPRLSSNFQPIVIILMKVLIKISKKGNSESLSKYTLNLVTQCFEMLEKLCSNEYKSFVNQIKDCSDMKDCYLLIIGHQEERTCALSIN